MNLYSDFTKRAVQGTAVVLTLGLLTANAIFASAGSSNGKKYDESLLKNNTMATAGVSDLFTKVNAESYDAGTVKFSTQDTVEVAEAEATPVVNSEWANRLMTTSESSMNVREAADANSALVGKLRAGDVAEIVSSVNGWYQITSGNVNGYVSADYVVTGDEAEALAKQLVPAKATATAGGLRVRSEANENASAITALYEGQVVDVRGDAEAVEGWTAVTVKGKAGYVKSEYVTVSQEYSTAITIEEEQAAIAAAKKAEEEKAAKEAAKLAKAAAAAASSEEVNTEAAAGNSSYEINTSASDLQIIAAVIQCEARNQVYEGKIAVGATIMNRCGGARSVQSVVFARNQYYPASSAKLARAISNPDASCLQAAADAMAGVDPTGGLTSYRPVRSGHAGLVIDGHVFF